MRCVPSARRCAGFACISAVLLLLHPYAAGAACNPASCEAEFDCGSRLCDGPACATFFADAGTECRSAAGVCDRAESCNGRSLACPSDTKRSATVCRGAADDCDGAERCDGSSNDCPADVGLAPTIDRLTLLDRTFVAPNAHVLHVVLEGANLCTTTIESPTRIPSPTPLFGGATPESQVDRDFFFGAPLQSETYSFDVNRGAAAGTLEFVAGAPDGRAEIMSPTEGAVIDGSDPVFSISNGCSNCEIVRIVLSDGVFRQTVAETADDFAPPLGESIGVRLEEMIGTPPPLPEGVYVLEAEAIDGVSVAAQSFTGDTSGIHFTYQSGTSIDSESSFHVPEPAAWLSTATAIAVLAACMRGRRHSRRGSFR
jgi:hypothetical protein